MLVDWYPAHLLDYGFKHTDEDNEQFTIEQFTIVFTMTWTQQGTRFVATYFEGSDDFCYTWVTAVCGKKDARRFRVEIRTSSGEQSPKSSTFHCCPVLALDDFKDATVDLKALFASEACSVMHRKVLYQKYVGKEAADESHPPVTCSVYEKVLVDVDPKDLEEKTS